MVYMVSESGIGMMVTMSLVTGHWMATYVSAGDRSLRLVCDPVSGRGATGVRCQCVTAVSLPAQLCRSNPAVIMTAASNEGKQA